LVTASIALSSATVFGAPPANIDTGSRTVEALARVTFGSRIEDALELLGWARRSAAGAVRPAGCDWAAASDIESTAASQISANRRKRYNESIPGNFTERILAVNRLRHALPGASGGERQLAFAH
jgi:hypothetical protein